MNLDLAAACSCGEVIFDLSERAVGEVLQCPWCAKQFRFAGVGVLEPVRVASGRARKIKRRGRGSRQGVPGGLLVMLLFILGFNALVYGAVEVLLPKDALGAHHLLWNTSVILPKEFWLSAATVVAGHLAGFTAWVCYLYWLHRRGKLSRS